MLRPLALTLLVLISACASRERPVEAVGSVPVEAIVPAPEVEPPDPRIHPLSREEEELAR